MKKTKIITGILVVLAAVLVFSVGAFAAEKEYTYGDFKYTVLGDDTVKIVGYTGNDEKVSVPDIIKGKAVTVIGEYAFNSCDTVESITIPGSVKTLEKKAIHFCDELKTVRISGDSLTAIEGTAIENCSELETVYIPKSVETIGVFMMCKSLENIIVAEDNPYLTSVNGVVYTKDKKALVKYPQGKEMDEFPVLKGVECIRNNAFYETGRSVGKIYITKDVKIIEEMAFAYSYAEIHYVGAAVPASWKNALAGRTVVCNSVYSSHTYAQEHTIIKYATMNGAGSKARFCICGCGKYTDKITIPAVKSVSLSKTNYIYDGKNKTPTVTVKDTNGKKLVKNVDYKLSVASKRSGIGRYTVKVTFIGNYSGTKSVYFYIKPGKTASVKSASQTTSSVKLSWSAVPGAAGYTVYRYSPAKKAYVKAGTTTGTSLTVKSLYAGTKYTFRVVAYGKTSAGKVYDSDSYTLLKTATKTKTPELTKVTSSAKGKATLTYSDVSGETGYTVYYSTKKDSGFKKYNNFKADTKTCSITGLTSGKTYYFKVRTYITTDSGYVYSAWSAVKSVKVK